MRRPTRTQLVSSIAVVALLALGAGAWSHLSHRETMTDEELPRPPDPPRLADGPEARRCMALLRDDPQGARGYALAWEARGGGEGAQYCDGLAILALGEPLRAAERLEAIASRSSAGRTARAAVFAQAGQAWLMAGDADRAFAAATLALTLTPEDGDLLIDRAVALASLGRYAEALTDLDAALAAEPDRAEALVFRAAAWRHLRRADAALRDIERALTLAPANAEALLERGILRQLAGDGDGARADWERVLELAPDSATADLAAQNLALNAAGPAP